MRFEERDLLLARLLECKTFQDAAQVLHERIAEGRARSVARTVGPEEPFRSLAPDPLERVSLDALLAAARAGSRRSRRRGRDRPRRADPRQRARRDRDGARAAARPRRGAVPRAHVRRAARSSRSSCASSRCSSCSSRASSTSNRSRASASSSCARSRAGERVALDLASLDEWGDEPLRDAASARIEDSRRGAGR